MSRTITLQRLVLDHFQGGIFDLKINGESANIFGQNRAGKTRLASGFSYLLYGADSLGRKEFSIKDLNENGEVAERGIDHSVEATLMVDGEEITIKKIFREKWVKVKGRAQAEFSGHSTQHFYNGIPVQEKEYKERITGIAGQEETFRLLTSPTVFPNLPWQRQRSILLDVVGDLSDQDVIASNSTLSPLPAILGKRSLDDQRKVVMARRSEINKEFPNIGVRIDEVRRGIPDVAGIDRKKAEQAVQHFETALNDAKLRLQGVNTGGNVATLAAKLSGINADLRKMEEGHRIGSLATLNKLNQEISEVEASGHGSRRRITEIDGELKRKDSQVQILNTELPKLREQWKTIDAETFKDTISNICPACLRDLPSERVQEARDKALAAFNQSKAERLGEINRKGHTLKDQRDQLQEVIDVLKQEKLILEEKLPANEAEVKHIIEARDSIKRNSEDFSDIPGRQGLLSQVSEIEAQIKSERDGKAEDIDKIRAEVQALQVEYSSALDTLSKFTTREQGEKRVEELKGEEKKLAKAFELLEGELFLMDQFIRAKVSLLTDRINSKFETVRFKLFNQLISGGVEECCVATVEGVPMDQGLNNSGRVWAGLEIVKVLQNHFKLICPTFLDNREGYTNIPDMPGQIISLYVSPDDKTLRVETVAR
jgi:hypothetical protein